MRKAIRTGRLPSVLVDGPRGREHRVTVDDVRRAMPAATAAPSPARPMPPAGRPATAVIVEAAPPAADTLTVPLEEWRRILSLVGHFTSSARSSARPRAHAARLEERLTAKDSELEQLATRALAPAPSADTARPSTAAQRTQPAESPVTVPRWWWTPSRRRRQTMHGK